MSAPMPAQLPENEDLKAVGRHFAFGENWASYAQLVTEEHVRHATAEMQRLFAGVDLTDRSFLDIGCGSGIHAAAALRLGCGALVAIDIDETSVATTRATLGTFAADRDVDVRTLSVFAADPKQLGQFDVVYSWGVLHHTGGMWEAVRKAASLVAPGGYFAIALYRKTPLCGLWRLEKRFYANAPRVVQKTIRAAYIGMYRLKCAIVGKDFHAVLTSYKQQRGMDYEHDVHDWLGGYPYESATPQEVRDTLEKCGLTMVREFSHSAGWGLTVHCDEYVFQRSMNQVG
jgi:SAM-dependent methyltransferase